MIKSDVYIVEHQDEIFLEPYFLETIRNFKKLSRETKKALAEARMFTNKL